MHDERFCLAEEAPICNGKLKGEFGYLARTDVVKKVLNGTYSYANDFDEASYLGRNRDDTGGNLTMEWASPSAGVQGLCRRRQ